jgi:hypothetical protein
MDYKELYEKDEVIIKLLVDIIAMHKDLLKQLGVEV